LHTAVAVNFIEVAGPGRGLVVVPNNNELNCAYKLSR